MSDHVLHKSEDVKRLEKALIYLAEALDSQKQDYYPDRLGSYADFYTNTVKRMLGEEAK